MREAIGSSWFLGVAAIFIALFITFLGISINYTKSFNVKNTLINAIEEREGLLAARYNGKEPNLSNINATIDTYGYTQLNNRNYNQYENSCRKILGVSTTSDSNSFVMGGTRATGGYAYCVRRICQSGGGSYYKVVSFASIEIPIVGIDVKIPISGETKTIYCDINDNQCKRSSSECPIRKS